MNEMKLPVQTIRFILAISWAVLSCTQVQVQPVSSLLLGQSPTLNPKRQLNQSLVFAAPPPPPDIGEPPRRAEAGSRLFAAPPPPPDIGEPGRRAEAGSRGCEDINKPPTSSQKRLTALVPVYPDSGLVLGATIAPAPTFWFYTPYKPPFSGKFILQDKDGQLVYQSDVRLPETPGAIGLSLPKGVAPLEIGKPYHWFFKVYCKAQEPPAFVEGWIQRNSLNPVLKSQLDKATPRDRVALYAANGIWFEALSTAGSLRHRDPQDTSWATLLQAVGLGDLANEPIVTLEPIAQ